MIKKPDFLMPALMELCPGAHFAITGTDSKIEWKDSNIPKPSDAEIAAKLAEYEQAWNDTLYQKLRAREYPPLTDYVDAVVKNDQEQIDAYIAACQAVKNKYPKP
jgi:hypothetical protein